MTHDPQEGERQIPEKTESQADRVRNKAEKQAGNEAESGKESYYADLGQRNQVLKKAREHGHRTGTHELLGTPTIDGTAIKGGAPSKSTLTEQQLKERMKQEAGSDSKKAVEQTNASPARSADRTAGTASSRTPANEVMEGLNALSHALIISPIQELGKQTAADIKSKDEHVISAAREGGAVAAMGVSALKHVAGDVVTGLKSIGGIAEAGLNAAAKDVHEKGMAGAAKDAAEGAAKVGNTVAHKVADLAMHTVEKVAREGVHGPDVGEATAVAAGFFMPMPGGKLKLLEELGKGANIERNLGRGLAVAEHATCEFKAVAKDGSALRRIKQSAPELEHLTQRVPKEELVKQLPHDIPAPREHPPASAVREAARAVDTMLMPGSHASTDFVNSVYASLKSLPAEDMVALEKRGWRIHVDGKMSDVDRSLALQRIQPGRLDTNESALGVTVVKDYQRGPMPWDKTKYDQVILPEHAKLEGKWHSQEALQTTEYVVKHEVGHAVAETRGLETNPTLLHLWNIQRQKIKEEWNALSQKTTLSVHEKERQDRLEQLARYCRQSNNGFSETVADLYAIDHGGLAYNWQVDLAQGFKGLLAELRQINYGR